jgi:acetolactate synthase-1/2/3 large subunit
VPVVTTLMARGAFPDSHPQHLGMPGMHGTVPAVLGLQESDLIIALGSRFDDRVTGKTSEFAPNAKIVHVDIDPAEIGKIRAADVPIVGDAKEVIIDLIAAWATAVEQTTPDYTEWWTRLSGLREQFPLGYTMPTRGSTPAAPAPWATAFPPPWAPRSQSPTAWSGRSTATDVSR